MSILHHHDRASDEALPESYEVVAADGRVRRYAREAFDMIVETSDCDEVEREVERGWLILDERRVTVGRRRPYGDDLITGIEGLRVSGVLEYESGETETRYTIGYLRDGAVPEDE